MTDKIHRVYPRARNDLLQFLRYTNIENLTSRTLKDTKNAIGDTGNRDWVVTEKIHGCNMCLITDGVDIKASSRNHMISSGDYFYGWQDVVECIRFKVLKLHRMVAEYVAAEHAKLFAATDLSIEDNDRLSLLSGPAAAIGSDSMVMWLYGELFGGSYPQAMCRCYDRNAKRTKPIQKEVLYCDEVRFCAFDIAIGENTFLDFDVAYKLLDKCGIMQAEPLFIGSLDDAASYSTHFQTTIPQLLGLHQIPENTAEGVVIKRTKGSRPILKHKDAKFLEVTTGTPQQKRRRTLADYVNSNRVDSLLSKYAPGMTPSVNELVRLLLMDAVSSYATDSDTEKDALRVNATKLIKTKLYGFSDSTTGE